MWIGRSFHCASAFLSFSFSPFLSLRQRKLHSFFLTPPIKRKRQAFFSTLMGTGQKGTIKNEWTQSAVDSRIESAACSFSTSLLFTWRWLLTYRRDMNFSPTGSNAVCRALAEVAPPPPPDTDPGPQACLTGPLNHSGASMFPRGHC